LSIARASSEGARVTGHVSHRMAAVRRSGTQPELTLRKALRQLRIRVRLQDKRLPGTPDIVIAPERIAIFVHGCFWHRHEGCRYATTPKSNASFWREKFAANVRRDARDVELLHSIGWRVLIAWECELRTAAAEIAARVASLQATAQRADVNKPLLRAPRKTHQKPRPHR
jgi:DNA mismatch endonuclease, patch repair protein